MADFGETKHGIGSYTLKNGERRYRVLYTVGRKVQSKAGFRSVGEAKAWQRRTMVAIENQEHVEARRATETFGAYVERWLTRMAADPGIRPNTWAIYEGQYRIHLAPTFAKVEFRHLDTEAVRTWYVGMKRKKKHGSTALLSQASCAKAYKLLRRICGEAVEDGYLKNNPCRIKKAATESAYVQAYEEPPGVGQIRHLAEAVPERYRAMVLLAGFGGLRWGELAGLQRRHVNLTNGTVRVEQQLVRGRDGRYAVGPPKTEAGKRTVFVPGEVITELAAHLNVYVDKASTAHVFTGDRGAWLRANNFRRRVWLPATDKVGCPGVRFHDLRHAAGTLAAMTGAGTKDLMARMGHASQAAAILYRHATQAQQQAIATRLDAILTESDNVVPLRKAK